jgi:hypothetical protein
VGTTGRHGKPGRAAAPGRRRRAILLAAATAVVLAGLTAAGLAADGGARPSTTADSRRVAATGPSLAFCQVRPGHVLRTSLDRAVAGSGKHELQPLGPSGDGREVFVSAWTPGFSGVAALSLATGRLTPVRAFGNPATDQADGASDGHWLVWAQTYSLSSLDHFTMYAWDAATSKLLRIGGSIAGPGGQAWPSPWHAPAVSGHYAAWAQGYGPGGQVEVRLADLLTGQVTTIRTGHAQPPFFDGDLVVWPESDAPGARTTLRAWSLTRHRLVALPAALRAVHGTEFVVSDGTRTAYLSPDLTRLYYSPREDQPARLALRLAAGVSFADLVMAPGALAWTTSQATYLASTTTGAFTRVTPRYGYATGSGSVILVTDGPRHKQVHPALPMHVINPEHLSWPDCPASRAAAS